MTFAPSRANSIASLCPMPLAPPLTIATLSFSLMSPPRETGRPCPAGERSTSPNPLWDNAGQMTSWRRRFAIIVVLLAGIAVLLGTPGPARAVEPKVRVELLSEVASIVPGETFWLALRQAIAPGWHTYWMNPGDSGEPPRIEWSLPNGLHGRRLRVAAAGAHRRGARDDATAIRTASCCRSR